MRGVLVARCYEYRSVTKVAIANSILVTNKSYLSLAKG
jgi:hypothetical protein